MNFDYNEYYTFLFAIPLVLIVVAILVIGAFLSDIIFLNKLVFNKRFIKDLFVLVFTAALLITGVNQLNCKIRLDSRNEVTEISGKIEAIISVESPPRFHFEDKIAMPKMIIIDGQEYYIMTVGDYSIGDDVVIEYLPNSLIIMTINYLNN